MNFKNWLAKIREKLYKKNSKNVKDKIDEIMKKMPELFVRPPNEPVPIREGIRAYHEIKSIRTNKINNVVMILLTIIIILLTALQLSTQLSSAIPKDADIKISLVDGSSYNLD